MGLYVYITPLPPGGSCLPALQGVCAPALCATKRSIGVPHLFNPLILHRICSSRPAKLSWNNCYGISCHPKDDCKRSTIQICNEVTRLMHLILSPKVNHKSNVGLHPLSLKVIVIPATTKPKASWHIAISAQVFQKLKSFLQSHGNACAGDQARQTPNFNYLLTVLRDISPWT